MEWKIYKSMKYEPNVVTFKIMEGWKQWFVARAYLPPNDQPTVHQVEHTLARCPSVTETLLIGNLKTCLAQPGYHHKAYLATSTANHGLQDQTLNLIIQRLYRGERD